MIRAVHGPHAWPRMIGGQIDGGQCGELTSPEVELPFELRTERCAALPKRVIAIADRQCRQFERDATLAVVVERREFATEHTHGPLVAGNVMQNGGQYVCFAADPKQAA